MRHLISLFVALGFAGTCAAQTATTADQAIAAYDFQRAESLLNTEITQLRRKRQSTDWQETQLQYVHKAMEKMSAVERVVVFDSMVVPRDSLFSALCLSSESGRVSRTSDFGGLNGGDGTLFLSEIGDKAYYGAPGSAEALQLYSSDIFSGEVGGAEPLMGLNDEPDVPHNYPFMMPDGITLYFAAQGEESLGGYDIFMTRYDPDTRRFLSPENVGMPFNSPANDYLMCIDEAYNVGCFVTDRNMPFDSVCVYYFIPNSVRRVYIEEEVGPETLRKLAMLSDIHLTWGAEMEVKAALSRLQECRQDQESVTTYDFTFVVAENHTCHSLADFRSQDARELAETWMEDVDVLDQWKTTLSGLRQTYAVANSSERNELKPKILKLESETENLSDKIRMEEKAIRKAELMGQ